MCPSVSLFCNEWESSPARQIGVHTTILVQAMEGTEETFFQFTAGFHKYHESMDSYRIKSRIDCCVNFLFALSIDYDPGSLMEMAACGRPYGQHHRRAPCFLGGMFKEAVCQLNPDELASLGDFECSDVLFSWPRRFSPPA